MSTDLQIAVSQEQGNVAVTVLRLKESLDASTHKALEAKASGLVAGGAENLLLDLSGVSYMGSAGFRAIQAITKLLPSEGDAIAKSANLKLLSPSAEVMKVIKTLGLDRYLDIQTDLDAAVPSF